MLLQQGNNYFPSFTMARRQRGRSQRWMDGRGSSDNTGKNSLVERLNFVGFFFPPPHSTDNLLFCSSDNECWCCARKREKERKEKKRQRVVSRYLQEARVTDAVVTPERGVISLLFPTLASQATTSRCIKNSHYQLEICSQNNTKPH